VISPIGKEGSEIRSRSDQILKYVIAPVADACGYEALRADKISESGFITTQVINHIINDPMVVADLTGHNANVFYELAVRHASRKPFVQMIQRGEIIPFDLAGIRTIDIDHKDLESVELAKDEMGRQMRAMTVPGVMIENPISTAVDFDNLKRSDDPAKRQLADILQGLGDIKSLIEKRLPRRYVSRPAYRPTSPDALTNPTTSLADSQVSYNKELLAALKEKFADAAVTAKLV
jgi:hypothetical protein